MIYSHPVTLHNDIAVYKAANYEGGEMRKLLGIVGMAMLAFTFACGGENANNGNANRPMNANRPPVNANVTTPADTNTNTGMVNSNMSSTNANMSNANRGNANR
jgi:hypothetical protein